MAEPHGSRRLDLQSLLRDRRLDIIPASTYGVDRYSHPWMGAEPSFARVIEYTDSHEHILALHLSYYASFGLTDVLGVADRSAMERNVYRGEGSTHTELLLHTPRGDLSAHYTENEGVHTVWRHDLLIKTDNDIDRFLAAPFAPTLPDVGALERAREALGDRGLVEIEVPDPLCLVVENMSYEDFMVRTVLVPQKIDALLDRAAGLIYTWLEGLLRVGFGPVFRIFGPEYAAPPVMSLKLFRKYVSAYDRPLVEMIHRYGGFVRYHCHGPIRRILDEFLSLGVDIIDPCEAPPSGDITLRELADRVGEALVLMGNIQLDDIERADAEKIDRLVAEAVDAVAGRSPFILCTTACPFSSPLPVETERNLMQFLASAEKYRGRVRT